MKDATHHFDGNELYLKEIYTKDEIISKIKFEESEVDCLLFIDELFKKNIDKLEYIKVLGIYIKDGRLKSYNEIMIDKEKLFKKYNNDKVNEVFEYIIKSDPTYASKHKVLIKK